MVKLILPVNWFFQPFGKPRLSGFIASFYSPEWEQVSNNSVMEFENTVYAKSGSLHDNKSDQFLFRRFEENCSIFCSEKTRFLRYGHGVFVAHELSIWKIGKWSDMSVYKIPLKTLSLFTSLLQNMLSINDADLAVTRVGFVIQGNGEWQYIKSTNSCVGPWVS